MNYVGKEIRGFRFSNKHLVGYISPMNRHIGQSGIITRQTEKSVLVKFLDGECWSYPIELIDKHLIKPIRTMKLSELKVLYEEFESYNTRERVNQAIDSIGEGLVTIEDISEENYFIHENKMYSMDEYVILHNGEVCDRDEAFFCDGLDEYVHSDDTVRVIGRRGDTYLQSLKYVDDNHDFIYFDGDYYDESGIEWANIVWVEDLGTHGYADDNYYHDGSGEYYSFPEDDDDDDEEEYVRGYHNGSYCSLTFDNKSKYRIGYEIEKEDPNVKECITIRDFEERTGHQWRKERDGSLNDYSGYELISPTFEFDIDKIFEHIEGNEQLVAHINADISTSCGGHIHLSEQGLNGEEMFEKVKGYTPLFYALYYGRVDKTFSKGKSNRDLQNENEKYQAIKIHHDRIEFRIISAVPNVKTLKWRTKLLRMILEHPTDDVIKAYYNVDTKFTKLLKQTYSDEKLIELKERFVKFTKQFEGIEVKQ
jgi:hypothetical protein